MELPAVIQFSGGRTSGYLLHKILEERGGTLPDSWKVCFQNTGKEREETLVFIDEVSRRWGVPITWLEYADDFNEAEYIQPDGTYKIRKSRFGVRYSVVDFATAARHGEPFLRLLRTLKNYRRVVKNANPLLPTPAQRLCTSYMKRKVSDTYLRDQGWVDFAVYMGIRADEQHRAVKLRANMHSRQELRTPLVEWGVDKAEVQTFWKNQPFDLQLDPNSDEGNCDLCYLKATGKLIQIVQKDPSRAEWWMAAEEEFSGTFSKSKLNFHDIHRMVLAEDPALEKYIKSPIDKTLDCFCGE